MAAKVVAIATGSTALELGLTGIPVEEIPEIGDVERRAVEIMEEGDADLLILDESFRGEFSEWFNNRVEKHADKPLLIYCPRFEAEDPKTDEYINSIVRPAVGFEIRLD